MERVRVALRLVRGVYWGSLVLGGLVLLVGCLMDPFSFAGIIVVGIAVVILVLGQLFAGVFWKCPHCDSRFRMWQIVGYGDHCPSCGNDIFSEDPSTLIEINTR